MKTKHLALLAAFGAAVLPMAASAQVYTSTVSKEKKPADTAKKPAPKPEDWKTPAPDTTGLNFKGQKQVTLAVATDESGKLTKAVVDKSSGDPALDKRVSEHAMKKWSGPKSVKAKIPVTVGG